MMLPDNNTDVNETADKRIPSKTYKIDFEKNRLDGFIDGAEALSQAVLASLMTRRYAYPIFSNNYGTDYDDVMSGEYLKTVANLKSAVIDSLMIDDRITGVESFEFTKNDNSIMVKFLVKSIFGETEIETEVK